MIGDTLADPLDPRPLPVISIDEPALSMTVGNEGMIVGENARADDLDVNATKEKLTNMRSSNSEELVRKVELGAQRRQTAASRKARGLAVV